MTTLRRLQMQFSMNVRFVPTTGIWPRWGRTCDRQQLGRKSRRMGTQKGRAPVDTREWRSMSSELSRRTLSYVEAETLAKTEAKRILQLDSQAICYVKFNPDSFPDYCRVDIVFDSTGRGLLSSTLLPLSERLDDEQLTDAHVEKVAKGGRVIDAIRLYRLLHSVHVGAAGMAVQRMLGPLELIGREELLARAAALPEPPIAFEAYWEGDTTGWFVVLEAVLNGNRRHDLAALRAGTDYRLFVGEVPPWPEAELAKAVGAELAERYGVPFNFASPDHP